VCEEGDQAETVRVDLEVVELEGGSHYLVTASERGQAAADVEFTSVRVSAAAPVSFEDVTANTAVTMVMEGIYLVAIELPPEVDCADLVAFAVTHSDDGGERYGFTLFGGGGESCVAPEPEDGGVDTTPEPEDGGVDTTPEPEGGSP
jgi:hypothetical protein